VAKKRHFRWKKSSIKSGIQNSNREAIQQRARDAIDAKFAKSKVIKINLKDKKAPVNNEASWKPYGNGKVPVKPKNPDLNKLVQIVDTDGTTKVMPLSDVDKEIKEVSGKRFTSALRQAGLDYGTQVLYDRTEMEKQEAIIHSAGVYTSPRNQITKKSYDINQIKLIFGDAWKEVSDDFENVYDENILLRYHDMLRVDGDIDKALRKSNRFITGVDYPQLILDTNCSLPSSESESYELHKIQNNFVFWSIKNELERIDRSVNTYNAMQTQLYQARGYQRGALLIERDEYGCPIALKPLSALRLNRVFVHNDTWRFMGVECADFSKPNNIILSEDLVYMVNRDYGQSIASYQYGYSDLEFIIHLVELNLIINSIVLKEINRTHWAPYVFIQLMDTEDEDTAADFIAKAKRGLSMVSLLPFKVDAIPPSHSGQFVVDQRLKNSVEIVSSLGVPYDLVSASGDQAHANLSTRLQAYNQTDVKFYRLLLRQTWEPNWYGRNIMAVIRRRYLRLKAKLASKRAETTSVTETPALAYNDELVAQSIPSPGEITLREARNRTSLDENDAIIEYEREIWEINRKLQISKVKSLIEAEIAANGVALDEDKKQEIFDDIGGEWLSVDNNKPKVPTPEEYFDPKRYDEQPFDLSSETGLDVLSPSSEEFELQQLEKLLKFSDPSRLPFKIKMLFKNVSYDTDIETALYTIGLFQAEIIGKERAQEKTGNEDLVQQTKEETQIKLFLAKALAPIIQEQMEVERSRNEALAKQGIKPPGSDMGAAPMNRTNPGGGLGRGPTAPSQTGGTKKPNSDKNQLDLHNRTNVATRLQKRSPLNSQK
jgi:hypothetical protein